MAVLDVEQERRRPGHLPRPAAPLGHDEQALLQAVFDVHSPALGRWGAPVDWQALVVAAEHGTVLPLLADRVLSGAVIVPDGAARDLLREALQETAVYNTRLLAELARTVGVLREAGIEHLALKGAALMLRHYPRPAMRHAVDFDLLIDPARFDEGLGRLRDAGYVDAPVNRHAGPDGASHAPAPEAVRHAGAALKGPSGVNVDLHFRVPTSGFRQSGGFHGWLARSAVHDAHGVPVRVCSPDDLSVHLCEHFAMQNYADPEHAPRLVADLRAIHRARFPAERLSVGPARARVAVQLARHLYAAVFDPAAAPHPGEPLLNALLRRFALGDPAVATPLAHVSNLRGHARRIRLDLIHRPAYALRTWVPTREYLGERYGVDPNSARIYPLYVTRLLRAATRPLWRRPER